MLHLFIQFICKNFSTYNFLSTYNWILCFRKYLGTKDSQLCLINAAHKRFITKTKKEAKTALNSFMRAGEPRGRGQSAEKSKYAS